ncbi:hypothetical protein CBM2587_B90760 [Cupriavidus taiwanensis]|uniref:Uncharacterized protein n=1 Tax=Cupriavidus taiwanensis TaxID=164546 RepID=A0A375CEJ8_9BURK|nr:hypothetical protein CBM2587_B90760 [Cupriavidus taiwanensis]
MLNQRQHFIDHHVDFLHRLARAGHAMHGAADRLAFAERRTRPDHRIQQRDVSIVAKNFNCLARNRHPTLDHIGHHPDQQGFVLYLGMLGKRFGSYCGPQVRRRRHDRNDRKVGNQQRTGGRCRMDGWRAVDHDVVIILDKFADLTVHRAAGRREADHRGRERPLIAGLGRPPGRSALFVHVDQHGARTAQAQRAGKVHADRGLAATAFLVKDRNDFGWHATSLSALKARLILKAQL